MEKVLSSTISESTNQRKVNHCVTILVVLCFIRIFLLELFLNDKINYLSVFLASVSAFVTFVAVIFVFDRIERSVKILGALLILAFAVSFLIHKSGFEYICNTFTVLGLIAVLPYTNLKRKAITFFTVFFVAYGLILILLAPKFGEGNKELINVITNTSSFVMFYLMCILFAFMRKSKNNVIPFIFAIIALLCQFLFVGRSSLIGTAIFLICLLFRRLFNKASPKVVRNLQIVLCVLAVAFAYFYAVILYEAAGYGSIVIFGKDIYTGRQIIWSAAFERIKGNLLFGIGNVLTAGNYVGIVNIHNQILGYLTCFGLIATVLIIVLIGLLTSRIYEQKQSNFGVALISAVIIMSYFETTFYASVHVVMFIVPLVIIYTLDRQKQSKEVKIDNTLLLAR